MFKKLQQTLWKVMLLSIFLWGVQLQASGRTAQADSELDAKATAVPNENSEKYKYFFPVLSASPQIKLSTAWTADSKGNPKTTFVPGETIRFYISGFNLTGSSSPAGISWYQDSPCGTNTLSVETVNLSVDDWTRYKSSVVPDCIGIHTFTLDISVDGQVTSYRTSYVVNYPSIVVSTTRQAFDRCNIPTTSQMKTWWKNSPYFGINIYMGGISRGCANSGLDAFWVNTVTQQGWELIPTWVGPQAPCSSFRYKMSSNATTAYQQGRDEATAAASTASELGLSKDRVIYYDLEGYATATTTCRSTVQSFLKGWTERLHELGVLSGVYGAAYSSYMTDWASIDPAPDHVWIASWIRSYYDPNVTVWGVNRLSDTLWANHQRLRQYAGDHVETWGGISFTIDSNVTDGAVTVLPKTAPASQNTVNPGSTDNPAQLREMQQVSSVQGWVIRERNLLWTEDGGSSWKDITPDLLNSEELLNALFLDELQGWLVAQNRQTNELVFYRTNDKGNTWTSTKIVPPSEGLVPQIQSAYLSFIDPQNGWVSLKHVSSSNFSVGSLYKTIDGGRTWSELALPVAGQVNFLNTQQGWLVGGASGSDLYATLDGGNTWEIQPLPVEPDLEPDQVFPGTSLI
jgi:photosystem II stability/assembly factor-like uncharacterized protein